MQKTRKAIAKRFKVSARGKVMRRTPGQRHRLRLRNTKQRRRSMKDKPATKAMTKLMKKASPQSF